MITSTGWRKIQGVPLNLNKAVPVSKKSEQRRWSEHHCSSCVVVGWVDCSTCQVLGYYRNRNCGAVPSVDCEHHGGRSHKSVKHWLSEKSHKSGFLAETEARRRNSTTHLASRSAFFQRPLRIRPNHARQKHPSKCGGVQPSGRVANVSVKLEMLLFEFFLPRKDALLSRHNRKLCTAELRHSLFSPDWDRRKEFIYYKTVSWIRPITQK